MAKALELDTETYAKLKALKMNDSEISFLFKMDYYKLNEIKKSFDWKHVDYLIKQYEQRKAVQTFLRNIVKRVSK